MLFSKSNKKNVFTQNWIQLIQFAYEYSSAVMEHETSKIKKISEPKHRSFDLRRFMAGCN